MATLCSAPNVRQPSELYLLPLGVIDIVRTQLWGEGGLQMRARGEGGIGFEYARILALKIPSILVGFDGRFI